MKICDGHPITIIRVLLLLLLESFSTITITLLLSVSVAIVDIVEVVVDMATNFSVLNLSSRHMCLLTLGL